MFDLTGKRIWIAGANGLVGGALCRRLQNEDCTVLTISRSDLDLREKASVEAFVAEEKPDVVVIAAAIVGSIEANRTKPVEFLQDNLAIGQNIIEAAAKLENVRLLNLGSSCIYPRLAEQPISEDSLLTGPLEPTNEAYAIAKITALKQAAYYRQEYGKDFITVVPTSLYGPGDHFDLERGHVIPALMRRFYDAQKQGIEEVTLWGSGSPIREFLHIDEAADGLIFCLQHYDGLEPINLSGGDSVSIRELADLLQEITGYDGRLNWDLSKPDGMPKKVLDNQRIAALGWQSKISLQEGLAQTWEYFLANVAD